jgi:hypothetical protein
MNTEYTSMTEGQLKEMKMSELVALYNRILADAYSKGVSHNYEEAKATTFNTKTKAARAVSHVIEVFCIIEHKAEATVVPPPAEVVVVPPTAEEVEACLQILAEHPVIVKPVAEVGQTIPELNNGASMVGFKTIRSAADALLLMKDENKQGMPYDDVLKRIFIAFPEAKTTPACLRWYANKLRELGHRVPDRPSSRSPFRKGGVK